MKATKPLILGLAGPICAGKTTVADFLEVQFGFNVRRSRQVLMGILDTRGETISESGMQDLGEHLRSEIGVDGLCELIMGDYNSDGCYVIDSLRHIENVSYFRRRFGNAFRLLYITAPEEVRMDRFLCRANDRDNSPESFRERTTHIVERDLQSLADLSDAMVLNIDIETSLHAVTSLALHWTYCERLTAFQEMIGAVQSFHRKHDFGINDQNLDMMRYRMGLLIEELGEISECLSKGIGDIAEEHADLLILLISNCITMGIDIEESFWMKYKRIMKRKSRRVGDRMRVSHWRGGAMPPSVWEYHPVDYQRLLMKGLEDAEEDEDEPTQLSFLDTN